MKKKMITALLASAMVLSLVACGGGGTDSNGGGDTSSSGSGTSSSSDSNKLTVWAWDQNFNIKAIETAAEQYKKDHPDQKVSAENDQPADQQGFQVEFPMCGCFIVVHILFLLTDSRFSRRRWDCPFSLSSLRTSWWRIRPEIRSVRRCRWLPTADGRRFHRPL